MKIRSGFVSNSSSSSFIVIATKETFDKAMSRLDAFSKEVINDTIGELNDVILDGKPFKMACGSDSSEEFAMDACEKYSKTDDDMDVLTEKAMDEWQNFKNRINAMGGVAKSTYS